MTQIDLKFVRRDNTNIRKYSDPLWRALRKERFKKADPDRFVNEMAAEQLACHNNPNSDFRQDVQFFISTHLSEREAKIFSLYVFGGKIGQVDIGKILGVCQATVANDLKQILELFKSWYFVKGENGYLEEV